MDRNSHYWYNNRKMRGAILTIIIVGIYQFRTHLKHKENSEPIVILSIINLILVSCLLFFVTYDSISFMSTCCTNGGTEILALRIANTCEGEIYTKSSCFPGWQILAPLPSPAMLHSLILWNILALKHFAFFSQASIRR